MRKIQFVLMGLCTVVLLAGASCKPNINPNATSIGRVVLASAIKVNNEPENDLEKVSAGTAVLYLTAEVLRPVKSTIVSTTWYKIPNQVVVTENFNGSRGASSVDQTDFDERYSSSWLASRAQRPGSSWTVGDYKVEVALNGKTAKTLFFSIVKDSEADQQTAAGMVSSIQFGDALGDDNFIAVGKAIFARDVDHLYVQLNLASSAKPGTEVQVAVRHLKEDLVINTFSAVVGTDSTIIFDLERSRFGKLWADRLWPTGSFEVVARMNGVVGKTASFQVKG
jgi:hypothetical protein